MGLKGFYEDSAPSLRDAYVGLWAVGSVQVFGFQSLLSRIFHMDL